MIFFSSSQFFYFPRSQLQVKSAVFRVRASAVGDSRRGYPRGTPCTDLLCSLLFHLWFLVFHPAPIKRALSSHFNLSRDTMHAATFPIISYYSRPPPPHPRQPERTDENTFSKLHISGGREGKGGEEGEGGNVTLVLYSSEREREGKNSTNVTLCGECQLCPLLMSMVTSSGDQRSAEVHLLPLRTDREDNRGGMVSKPFVPNACEPWGCRRGPHTGAFIALMWR